MAPKSRTAKPAAAAAAATADKPSVRSRTRKPTAKRASSKTTAKPAAKAKPVAVKQTDEARTRQIAEVGKLRGKGMKWDAIAADTGLSLSALARIRLAGKSAGIQGFVR